MRRALFAGLIVLAGCKGGEDPFCEEAPVVTYESFGRGLLTQHCQPCHSTTSANRNEAPEEIHFDSWDDVVLLRWDIYDLATGPDPLMPPQGGVTADDRYLIEVFLTCDHSFEAAEE